MWVLLIGTAFAISGYPTLEKCQIARDAAMTQYKAAICIPAGQYATISGGGR